VSSGRPAFGSQEIGTRECAARYRRCSRTGRAVEPDHVDAERLQRGQGGADLAAEQHRAGRLDSQLRDDERLRGDRRHRPFRTDNRSLRLEQVGAGLDDERVSATVQQAGRVLEVGVAQLAERDVAERGQLGPRADRAEHPARPPVRGGEFVRHLAGEERPRFRELGDAVGYPVLTQVAEVRAERVRGHAVGARFQVGAVDGGYDVRAGHVQDLVAALMPAEVVGRRVASLEHGAHRAVRDHHALGQGGTQRRRSFGNLIDR